MEQSERKTYLDIMRIIGSYGVILLHTAAQNWRAVETTSFEWNVMNIYDSLSRWVVPLFLMISGSLFLSRDINLKRLYGKNILRIVTAFFFWSSIYALLYDRGKSPLAFIKVVLNGHYHLWFLFVLVGLYIAVPILKQLVNNEKVLKYYLILSLIYSSLIPQVSVLFESFSPTHTTFILSYMNKLELNVVNGMVLYFVLGYYWDHLNLNSRQTTVLYGFGILGFLITIVGTFVASLYLSQKNQMFYEYLTFNVLLETLLIFTIVKRKFIKSPLSKRMKDFISRLAHYSFCVYLIHIIILKSLNQYLHLNTLSFSPVISIPAISLLVFSISYLLAALICKIPVLSKYIT